MKRLAALAAMLLAGLFAYIGSAVPASAAAGGYVVCNDRNSVSLLWAYNTYNGDDRIVISNDCIGVSNQYDRLLVDVEKDGICCDVTRYRLGRKGGSYGAWITGENNASNPPEAWEPYGVQYQTI